MSEIAQKAVDVVKAYIDQEIKKLFVSLASVQSDYNELKKSIKDFKLEKGDKGDSGANGKDGKDGRDGKDGQSVNPVDVFKYIDEKIKIEISNIPKAQDGSDGRDALDIEILPSIVPEKAMGAIFTQLTTAGYGALFQKQTA